MKDSIVHRELIFLFVVFQELNMENIKRYHTSADNLNLISNKGLQQSFEVIKTIIDGFENVFYQKTSIICEPNLGSRNLYPTTSIKDNYKKRNFMLDLITFSNGKDNIFDISQKTNIPEI